MLEKKQTQKCDYCNRDDLDEYYEINVKRVSGIIENVIDLKVCPECYSSIDLERLSEVSSYIPKHLKTKG